MLPTCTEGVSQLRPQVPHPTLSSADLLTGFCPGGVGVRVRTASWSPGKGVELGHNCIGAHLGSTVSRGSSPPHKRLVGSSALLLSPLFSMEKCGSWGLGIGLVGPHSVWHFQMHPTSAGVSGEGVLPLQSQNGRALGKTLDQTLATFLLCWAAKRWNFLVTCVDWNSDCMGGASCRRCFHSL